MKKFDFRLLRADEVEARVSQVTEKGVILLLYQDARCAMNALDAEFGPMNWKNDYELIDNQLFSRISVWDDDKKQWISKMDVGVESNTEEIKGRASDAFKRAAVRWGLGRELYTAPFIWIPASKVKITTGKNGNLACYDRFVVSEIAYDENRHICRLVIKDTRGQVLFTFGTTHAKPTPTQPELLAKLQAVLKKNDIPAEFVTNAYGVDDLQKISVGKLNSLLTEHGITTMVNSYKKKQQQEAQEELKEETQTETDETDEADLLESLISWS